MQPPDAGVENTEDKPWTRPWHPKEIRENAHHWNLAADAGLLKYLGEVSMNFMQKAQESTQGINSLVHDTSMADVRVRNVTDRFMTLSDSQFIENRVYDEDVSTDAVEDSNEKNKDDTEGDIDPFPKLKTAIQMGFQVLEESFDVLDPNAAISDFDSDLDSDDDEEAGDRAGEKLYEPRDPYVTRPLPYLIGSRGFQESDDVGIRDLPSDDEVVQDDQGSISESDEDIEKLSDRKDSVSSSSTDISESDLSSSDLSDTEQKTLPAATKFSSSSVSEDGDLFGDSDSEDEPKVVEQKPKAKAKVSHKVKETNKSRATSKTRAATNDLFGSDDDDDGNDLFGDSGGLFGNAPNLFDKKKKSSGLFDGADISDDEEPGKDSSDGFDDESQKLSSEEDDDIPDHKEVEVMSEKSSKPLGGIALFGGALTKELLSKTRRDSSTSQSESISQVSEKSSTKKSNNLFAAEDSDEDDLFSSKPKEKPKQKTKSAILERDEVKPPLMKKAPAKKIVSDLFGDDSDEDDMLFGDAPLKPVEKKVTAKPSLPKKKTAKPVTKQKPVIFDSESSDDDSMFSKKPPPMMPKVDQKTKSKDLFGSDSDDDFFADKMPTSKNVKAVLDSDSGDDLFADNSVTESKSSTIVEKNLVKPKAEKVSLFQDSDKELSFDNQKTDKSGSFKEEKVPVINVSVSPSKKVDDSEDDQDEPSPPPVKKKPVGAVSMFGGGFGGGELSAAILKRRGVSDVSTASSTNDGSQTTEPIVKSRGASKDEEINKVVPEKPVDATVTISTPPKQLAWNSTAKPFKSVGRPSPVKPPSSVTSPQSSVSNIRSTLTINPASLLPGAAPKPKPVVQAEISFDKPPDVKTLESVNKTRARGQRNRRPPTRHARGKSTPKTTVTPSVPDFSQNERETSEILDSVREEKQTTPSMMKETSTTESIDKVQATAQSNDNLFDDLPKDPKPHKNLLDSADLDDELFAGSLFAKTEKKDTKSKTPKLFNDDIFGDDDDFLTSLTSKKSTTVDSVKTLIYDADDDDIFGDLSIGNILGKKEKKTEDKKAVNVLDDDLFNEKSTLNIATDSKISKDNPKPAAADEPDIFSATSNEKSKTESNKSGLFDDDDDEDIFGGNSGASKTKQNPISNEDNDIFGDVSSTIQKPKSTKLPAKPDDDIFGDDIFSSKPASKKKVKQSKPTKKSAAASIFDDDQDLGDIFASSSTKKKTTTSKSTAKKSSKTKEPKSTDSSVIDDPLSMP